ncbi:F-box protein PP2-A13-like [Salvia miltiorrhiza]|uniref:F-box protein PP2-A13-like n=1 Tax=Salvia miltiorrhiza TaxID=226208 RepID=UPI0025AC37BE|nr:F-box protein PP2-A13-like [Salvia miltiorrhiza]
MGANASSMAGEPAGPRPRPRLEDIPESCVALALSYLDPPEIAKMARINRAFRAASSADFIWVPKLPSNFEYILSKLPDQALRDKGRMDIYAGLCRPNTFDGGTKEVWIDRRSGGVCLAISSKAMAITGIDDRRYWNHIPTDESRFQTVAYLQQIWWLEVDGELEFQLPEGSYSLFFRLHLGKVGKRLGRRVCNQENVHGWDLKPAQFQLTTQSGHRAATRCMIEKVGSWASYHVGEFVVEDPNSSTKVKFSLTQIDCTHTKGGLCVDSVLICPTSLGKEVFSVDGEACRKSFVGS